MKTQKGSEFVKDVCIVYWKTEDATLENILHLFLDGKILVDEKELLDLRKEYRQKAIDAFNIHSTDDSIIFDQRAWMITKILGDE